MVVVLPKVVDVTTITENDEGLGGIEVVVAMEGASEVEAAKETDVEGTGRAEDIDADDPEVDKAGDAIDGKVELFVSMDEADVADEGDESGSVASKVS